MGILPLQFLPGESAQCWGLSGNERFTVTGLSALDEGRVPDTVQVDADGVTFPMRVRLDTSREAEYYRHGGDHPLRHAQDAHDRQVQGWRDRDALGDPDPMTDDIAAGSSGSDAPSSADPCGADPCGADPGVQAEWDKVYADQAQLWSGQPNGALVAEVAGLPPGRVLDVGCGEGADAVWLARGGWDVTALDVSGVALERAAAYARDAGVAIRCVHAGLVEAALPPASFDLVSAQYPALLRTPDAAAERALLAAVAPGGVLLVVHHAGMETHQVHEEDFDPADYVWPSMVAAVLDDDWAMEVNAERPRIAPHGGAGVEHTRDQVLRARRLR
jgi:SAM-dependent methyltransferase